MHKILFYVSSHSPHYVMKLVFVNLISITYATHGLFKIKHFFSPLPNPTPPSQSM